MAALRAEFYQIDPRGKDPHHHEAWGRQRWMDTKIQSPLPRPRVYVTPAGCGSCSGVLVCLGGACRSRGAQNPKIDGCWLSFMLSGHLDLVKLDLSFKTRILSPSNSSGRPRYGSGSVLRCPGWVPHALIWSGLRFKPLKRMSDAQFQHFERPGS